MKKQLVRLSDFVKKFQLGVKGRESFIKETEFYNAFSFVLVDYKEPTLIAITKSNYPLKASILVIKGILHEFALSNLIK